MSKFPADWDEDRIRRVLEHYEGQSESEAVREDEAALVLDETLVQVPLELVPAVRALIARERAKQ